MGMNKIPYSPKQIHTIKQNQIIFNIQYEKLFLKIFKRGSKLRRSGIPERSNQRFHSTSTRLIGILTNSWLRFDDVAIHPIVKHSPKFAWGLFLHLCHKNLPSVYDVEHP